ncbi:MAG TPA: glycoside hydrolase family 31 protein [Kiritimatiellia bacterium]|nr:glycoside hydrolase family 31 protein [Kiritimatiellia bacterium]
MRIHRYVYVWSLLLCAAGILPASASVQVVEHVTATTIWTNPAGNRAVTFDVAPMGSVEVVPFAPDVVRVRFHFGGLFEREEIAIARPFDAWPAFTSTFTSVNSTNLRIETDALIVDIITSNRFQVHFRSKQGFDLLRDDRIEFNLDYNPIDDTSAYAQVDWPGESLGVSNFPSGFKLRGVKEMRVNEGFLGLGDAGGPLNRRGRKLQFWTQDTFQYGEFRTPKYTAFPMMYGVRGDHEDSDPYAYGFFFHNPARPVFDLTGNEGNVWTFEAGDDQLDYFFFGGGVDHRPEAVIDRYSELVGRPIHLPKWALGFHQSRHSYFSQQEVLDLAATMRSFDIPCDAIYLDIGSQLQPEGTNYQLTFNTTFTNVPGLIDEVGALGMKLVPLVEPCLTTSDPLYPVAFTNLYFLKANDLSTYVGVNFLGFISWLDFSISFTRDWWRGQLVDYLNAYGFEGIWNDLNEPNENAMPLDVVWFLDGRYGGGEVTSDTRKWHSNNKNTYSLWQSQVTLDALRERWPAKRPYVLSRSGWPGIQRMAAGWSGDNISSFTHLRFNNAMGLNTMISGQAWFGHDIGGFIGSPSAELFSRWIQAGSLHPLFRNHTDINSAPQEPWVWGDYFAGINRHWIQFRYRMMPYLYSLAAASITNGMPVNAPTAFYFLSDTNTYFLNDNDYMVGRDVLVAPVVEPNVSSREVYLPFGANWYDWRTGRRYLGGQTIVVPAFLADLPLFVREGTILPMGPVQNFANEFTPDVLELLHWPGGDKSFLLIEDDGETTNYQAGAQAFTLLSSQSTTQQVDFTIHARTGSYFPGVRDLHVLIHDLPPVFEVYGNGAPLTRVANRDDAASAAGSAWAYEARTRTLMVKVPDTGAAQHITADLQSSLDSDNDGIPDWWERAFFGSPTGAVATADSDGDGRNNLQEYLDGTHPLFADSFASSYTNMAVAGPFNFWNPGARNMRLVADHTWAWVGDFDGVAASEFKFVANNDWSEAEWGLASGNGSPLPLTGSLVANGLNIAFTGNTNRYLTFRFNETSLAYSVRSSWDIDSDGDGMPDAWEMIYGFDPLARADGWFDADRDGLANRLEYLANGSPIAPDTDGDGVSDFDEYVAGTKLDDPNDFLSSGFGGPTNLTYTIFWSAVTGRVYDVYTTTNLYPASWTVRTPFTNLTGSGPLSITDTSDAPLRVYRIQVRP